MSANTLEYKIVTSTYRWGTQTVLEEQAVRTFCKTVFKLEVDMYRYSHTKLDGISLHENKTRKSIRWFKQVWFFISWRKIILNSCSNDDRLGALYGQVLGIEPFKSNKKLWYRMFSKPFIENKPWAITKLTQIMEHTMIRNQRADMDKEVTLPPLYQNTIYLDFDYYQWMVHDMTLLYRYKLALIYLA